MGLECTLVVCVVLIPLHLLWLLLQWLHMCRKRVPELCVCMCVCCVCVCVITKAYTYRYYS